MIPVLPDFLYYDSQAATENEVEVELRPQFDIVFVKKFEKQFKVKYADQFYKNTTQLFFEDFRKPLETLINILFPILPNNSPFYIVDDEEEGEEEESEEEKEKKEQEIEAEGIVDKLFGKLKKKALGWIQNKLMGIKDDYEDKILKKLWKNRKKILRKIKTWAKKIVRSIKRFARKMRVWIKRFWKKVVKPFLRRCKRLFLRIVKRAKRVLLKVLGRAKRMAIRIFRVLIKKMGKILIKAIVQVGKKFLSIGIKVVLNAVAAGFTATGVGAIVGAAIWAGLAVWSAYEVYDIATDVTSAITDTEDLDEEPSEAKEEKNATKNDKKKAADAEKAAEKATEKELAKNKYERPTQSTPVEEKKEVKIQETNNIINDQVYKTLTNHAEYPYQIIGRQYYTYKITHNWLYAMQDFVTNIFDKVVSNFNKLGETMVKQLDKYDIRISEWIKHVPPEKIGKDPKMVKPPPRLSDKKIQAADKLLRKSLKEKKKITPDVVLKIGWDWKVQFFQYDKLNDRKTRENENDKAQYWLTRKAYDQGKEPNAAFRMVTDLDRKFDFYDELEDKFEIQEEKLKRLRMKNFLLYLLWNQFALFDRSLKPLNTTGE